MPCTVARAENFDLLDKQCFRVCRSIEKSGEIKISYVFPVCSERLKQEGFSAQEVEIFKFYLVNFVSALSKTNQEKATQGVAVSAAQYYVDVDGIGFETVFKNQEAMRKFFGNDKEESVDTSKKSASGFLIKKVVLETDFPISAQMAKNMLSVCTLAVENCAKTASISAERKAKAQSIFENCKYLYDFSTYQAGLNSQHTYEAQNGHHNVFVCSMQEIESGARIEYWQTAPNRGVWYAGALVLVVAGMVVAYFVMKKKDLKTNQ